MSARAHFKGTKTQSLVESIHRRQSPCGDTMDRDAHQESVALRNWNSNACIGIYDDRLEKPEQRTIKLPPPLALARWEKGGEFRRGENRPTFALTSYAYRRARDSCGRAAIPLSVSLGVEFQPTSNIVLVDLIEYLTDRLSSAP